MPPCLTAEFNSTFYKIPRPATVSNWAASVPDYFRFTFKLWKGITHNKELNFKENDLAAFFESINAVNEKKGRILTQFPPSIGREYRRQLEHLLGCFRTIDPTQDWTIALEFRNNSWYQEDIYELIQTYNSTLVIHDIPRSATPLLNYDYSNLYLRFHGPTGNYRESYSEDFLREYATLIKEWTQDGKTIYAYFNNTMGDAYKNLEMLNSFVHDQDLK